MLHGETLFQKETKQPPHHQKKVQCSQLPPGVGHCFYKLFRWEACECVLAVFHMTGGGGEEKWLPSAQYSIAPSLDLRQVHLALT